VPERPFLAAQAAGRQGLCLSFFGCLRLSNISPLNKLKGVKLKPPKPFTPKPAKPFRPTLPATFKPKPFTPLKPLKVAKSKTF
jgi:hypothetical protein